MGKWRPDTGDRKRGGNRGGYNAEAGRRREAVECYALFSFAHLCAFA